ncbi:hypothetical protein FGO68_gene17137 [Halteria grandinella]|uniref:Uncharacterized protein n=1 Tax=Halteria grandinella TaxID=5974 RepID=A0A8J8NJU2_HALGN|nr:hypothetical protein FGO68_gene17137 [Halteria grandinella]
MNHFCSACHKSKTIAQLYKPGLCHICFRANKRDKGFINQFNYQFGQLSTSHSSSPCIEPTVQLQDVSLQEDNTVDESERVRRPRDMEKLYARRYVGGKIGKALKQEAKELPLQEQSLTARISAKLEQKGLSSYVHRRYPLDEAVEPARLPKTKAINKDQKYHPSQTHHHQAVASDSDDEEPPSSIKVFKNSTPYTLTPAEKRKVTALPLDSHSALVSVKPPVVTSICQELLPADPTTHQNTLLVKMTTESYVLVDQTLAETLIPPTLLQDYFH